MKEGGLRTLLTLRVTSVLAAMAVEGRVTVRVIPDWEQPSVPAKAAGSVRVHVGVEEGTTSEGKVTITMLEASKGES